MWTLFNHDGHPYASKTLPFTTYTVIEAPFEEAKLIFENRYNWDPEGWTFCCGEDFIVSEFTSLPDPIPDPYVRAGIPLNDSRVTVIRKDGIKPEERCPKKSTLGNE